MFEAVPALSVKRLVARLVSLSVCCQQSEPRELHGCPQLQSLIIKYLVALFLTLPCVGPFVCATIFDLFVATTVSLASGTALSFFALHHNSKTSNRIR